MAGIGFELRRIFGKKTLASSTWGVIYASMTTVGPSIVFTMLLFILGYVMRQFQASELENLFFVSSFTYVFLLAILTAAFLNTVLSRYISDKIFEKKESDICASLFGILMLGSVIAAIEVTVLCLLMWRHDEASLTFLAAYYLLAILATNAYNIIIYISALKEYKEVTFSYILGGVIIIPLFLMFYQCFDWHIIFSIYWALVCGFFVINLLLVYWCVKAFGNPSEKYFEFLQYIKKYPKLIVSGFTYMLGFYISNIVYWFFSDMRAQVSIFNTVPNYDLAMFMSILVNLSGMVVFEVKTETIFYEKYVSYLSAINRGTYELIEKERTSLQNVINLQLFFVYEVQLIITILLICLANVFYPFLGISSQVIQMFMLLAMGVYCTFCMYFTIIFLYYFLDYNSACIAPSAFLVIVFLGSIICCKLGSPYYPIPMLIGGIIGWIISFVLLRRRLRNLNVYLLCS